MAGAAERRTRWTFAVSAVAHLRALAVIVMLQRPTLRLPTEASGPPEAIIPILILPRSPPPVAGRAVQPAPIQLHRRPQRNLPAESRWRP